MTSDPNLADPLFKGCTRPAMMFGIPLMPLVVALAVIVLLSVWTRFIVTGFLLAPVVLFGMRSIARQDDQMYRLLRLRITFRIFHLNKNRRFWQASAYSPFQFTRRKRGVL